MMSEQRYVSASGSNTGQGCVRKTQEGEFDAPAPLRPQVRLTSHCAVAKD